jgi:hypothetical protein
MKKAAILSLLSVFWIASISFGSNELVNRITDDKILIDSGIDSWVPNPLVGSHHWKNILATKSTPLQNKWSQHGTMTRRQL